MANLICSVDRLIGNYEDTFIYAINAGFSGIQGEIRSAQIKVFFPDTINVFIGDTKEPVKNVSENPVTGGTEVIYDFGSITDLGIAVRLGLGVNFKLSTLSGSTFTMNPTLWINDAQVLSYTGNEIRLFAEANYEIHRELVLPAIEPSAGSEIYYKLTLENFGDLGASIDNAIITCLGSSEITLDPSFPVIGKDVSTKFADTSMDGVLGTISGNTLNFSLNSYKGQRYEFIYKASIAAGLTVGEQLSTLASLSATSKETEEDIHEIQLNFPVYDASVSIYSPDYTLPEEFIYYHMNIANTGNQILLNAVFENELPAEVAFYQLTTGAFDLRALSENISANYEIKYTTRNGLSGSLGNFNTDTNTLITLTDFIPENDRLSTLTWDLAALRVGVRDRIPPSLFGVVDSNLPLATDLLDHMHLSFEDVDGTEYERFQNATTIVDDICVLTPNLSSSMGNNPLKPNQEFTYTLGVTCVSSRLYEPLLAILLPEEISYVGNEAFTFRDIFGTIAPRMPEPVVIPNFTNKGETLVKYQFDGDFSFSFRQLASFSISFQAKVAIGAYGEIESALLLNSVGSTGRIPNNYDVYLDTNDIANNPLVDNKYCVSNVITNKILFFVSTSSNKLVKGALDTEYLEEPAIGSTYEAGNLEYKITVKNIGNSDLSKVAIVDILPFLGDASVLNPSINRGSEFSIYSLSEVIAKLLPLEEAVNFDIQYSTSTDPIRFGPNFDIIGSDDTWSIDPPEDMSKLRSFQVTTTDTILKPGDSLEVTVLGSVPVGTSLGQVAWNSFAADVSYLDINDVEQHLLAVEPEKVGISIQNTSADRVEIGGFVFIDERYNGIYSPEDILWNDVGVILYNESRTVIAYTFTTPDADGKDGQYLFKNLAPGQYYIQFVMDDTVFKFTKQRKDIENGSLVNPITGFTELLDMRTLKSNRTVLAGILPKSTRTIDDLLKVNNSARGIMRDVVKNQMLLVMKQEDILDLIDSDLS